MAKGLLQFDYTVPAIRYIVRLGGRTAANYSGGYCFSFRERVRSSGRTPPKRSLYIRETHWGGGGGKFVEPVFPGTKEKRD